MTGDDDSRPLVASATRRFDASVLESGIANLINLMKCEASRYVVISLTEITLFRKRVVRDEVEFVVLQKQPGQAMWIYTQLFKLFLGLCTIILRCRNLGAPARIHFAHGRDVENLDSASKNYQWVRQICGLFVTHFIVFSRDLEHYLTNKVRHTAGENLPDPQHKSFLPAEIWQPIDGCLFDPPECQMVGIVGRM